MKRKRKFAVRMAQLAGDLFEVPSGGVPGGMMLTVADGREVYMTGCREILAYGPELVKVNTSIGVVSVRGEGLDIPKYADGEVTVRGNIAAVELSEEDL